VGGSGQYSNPTSPLSKLLENAYALEIQESEEPASSSFVPPYRPRRLTPKEVKGVIERYISGEYAATIGKELGINPATLRFALQKRGVKLRSPNDWRSFN
jgi:hypothetical protein